MTKGKGTPATHKSTTAGRAKTQPGSGPAPATKPPAHMASKADDSDSAQPGIEETISASWDCQRGWRGQIPRPSRSVSCILSYHVHSFHYSFAVERAHMMPAARGIPGAPPRTFILRLLNFRDRDQVLCEARKMDVLNYEGAHLMIFPDYSIDTQKLRRSFVQVKLNLRNRHIKYSMLFPARLRVQDGETVWFFTSPEDASHWLTLPRG